MIKNKTSLDVVNELRKSLELIINDLLIEMQTTNADTRFKHRMTIKQLVFVANKISILSHGMVDKINNAATDAAVGKEVAVRIQKTHQHSSYIPDIPGEDMMYMLRKRLQYVVCYEFNLARKWIIEFNMKSNFEDCMHAIDAYMLFAEQLKVLIPQDIEHTRAVQNACRCGNFSLNDVRYHLHGNPE